MQNFRKGDVVLVETTVRHDSGADAGYVVVDIGYGGHSVEAESVKMLRPFLTRGDKVDYIAGGLVQHNFTFIAGDGDCVWLKCSDGSRFDTEYCNIRRVEEPEACELLAVDGSAAAQ